MRLTELLRDYLAETGTRGAPAKDVLRSFGTLLAEATVAEDARDCRPLPEEEALAALLSGAPTESTADTSLPTEPALELSPAAETRPRAAKRASAAR